MEGRGEVDLEIGAAEGAPGPRRKWTLTKEAFDKLLSSFGPDQDTAAQKYLEIRNNLTRFFEWRGCPFPEEHADETLNRVARKLGEGEEIRNQMSYCIGVARMLHLEIIKSRAKQSQALGELASSGMPIADSSESEVRIDCLRSCLQVLSVENRDLIVEYYNGEKGTKIENRRRLTERFRVSINTLRMRALRLREKLQDCVEDCLNKLTSNL